MIVQTTKEIKQNNGKDEDLWVYAESLSQETNLLIDNVLSQHTENESLEELKERLKESFFELLSTVQK